MTNTKVETSVDGRISVAHCNDGNITTQEFAEIAGGITVSNASSTSQQQQTQPARTVTEGCSYNRYSNTGVKYLTGTTTGAPTSVGLITGEKSFLTESYCVQRCNAMEACTGVMYDINYMNNGFATCQLLSPPVQMFTYQPDPTKVDTSVTYIDNIQCGQQQSELVFVFPPYQNTMPHYYSQILLHL